jgi:DNA-binding transcriptional MerR regulator
MFPPLTSGKRPLISTDVTNRYNTLRKATPMPMTVSEMADRVAKRGASKAAFAERVHHWTRERLLSPVGKRNPGTGRHRVYDDSALEDVLFLDELANLGLPVGIQRTALLLARHGKAGWREKAERGVNLFLEIDMLPDGQRFPHLHEGTAFMANGTAKVAIIFNLTKLFAVLMPAGAGLTLTTSAPVVSVTTNKTE